MKREDIHTAGILARDLTSLESAVGSLRQLYKEPLPPNWEVTLRVFARAVPDDKTKRAIETLWLMAIDERIEGIKAKIDAL